MLERLTGTLAVYESQTSRNDYLRFLRARAEVNAVRGGEEVFGFGAGPASDLPYAELLTEVTYDDGWQLGTPRLLTQTKVLSGSQVPRFNS